MTFLHEGVVTRGYTGLEKLVSKRCNFPLLSPLPMCLRGPLADTDKHFAPVSTTKSPDAEKQTSKILLGLLHTIGWIISKVPTAGPEDQVFTGLGYGCWTRGWRKNSPPSHRWEPVWPRCGQAESIKQRSGTYQPHSVMPWQISDCRQGNRAMRQQTMPVSCHFSTAYWPHHSPETQ